jgi:hypothetical protein
VTVMVGRSILNIGGTAEKKSLLVKIKKIYDTL